MINEFIFWACLILTAIMSVLALCAIKYAADVKEKTIGMEGWNEWRKWTKDRDDLILQVRNWEYILERIEEAAIAKEEDPGVFPDPVEALCIQLVNDYTIAKNG